MTTYSYTIEERASELGGGWQLRLLEDDEEVGGGVFPLEEGLDPDSARKRAYRDAQDVAQEWLASR